MNDYVFFKATEQQVKELTCNIIESSGLERPDPRKIGIHHATGPHGFAIYIEKWGGRRVDVRIRRITTQTEHVLATWTICHNSGHRKTRPWKFDTALEAVESVEEIKVLDSP